MWIKDMFFFHELPRKINIWSVFIISSPYLGPFMASFVIWRLSWHWVYWIYAILNYAVFIIIVLFVDETFFDRNLAIEKQPAWKSRLLRLTGFERHCRYSFIEALSRPLIAVSKIPVIIITIFYFLNFAWTIGVNATIATWLNKYYHFDGESTGEHMPKPVDCQDNTNSARIVLLCSDNRMHSWCNFWALVARLHWQLVHEAPLRQDRSRSSPVYHLRCICAHWDGRASPWSSAPTQVALHGGSRFGCSAIDWCQYHLNGGECLPSRCISRSSGGSRRVDRSRPYNGWLYGHLY